MAGFENQPRSTGKLPLKHSYEKFFVHTLWMAPKRPVKSTAIASGKQVLYEVDTSNDHQRDKGTMTLRTKQIHVSWYNLFSGALCGLVYIFALPSLVYILTRRKAGTLTVPVIIFHVTLILLGLLNFISQFLIMK